MKTRIYFTSILLSVFFLNMEAQINENYLGAGNDNGIIVTSSNEFENSRAINTIKWRRYGCRSYGSCPFSESCYIWC